MISWYFHLQVSSNPLQFGKKNRCLLLTILIVSYFFREQAGRPKCPVDPFYIVPDKCRCVDFQVLKLQEAPEAVPNGELPRHLQLYCDRYLCEKVVPGNRVTVVGVYAIKKTAKPSKVGQKVLTFLTVAFLKACCQAIASTIEEILSTDCSDT